MKGPTMRRRIEGSARRTWNPSPRSRVRGRMMVSIGEDGSRSTNGSSGICQVMALARSEPRTRAAQLAGVDALRVRRAVRARPLGPAGVHLLDEETLLCQLQSGFRRELSRPAPAIRDELLVARQLSGERSQLGERHADRSGDVRLRERVLRAS